VSKIITITIEVPDGVEFTPQVTTASQNAPQAAAAPQAAPATSCPKHGSEKVKPSKFGGVYCTAPDESTEKGYCTWKAK
jgi:3-oxoacyl-ACP reductase-like protein